MAARYRNVPIKLKKDAVYPFPRGFVYIFGCESSGKSTLLDMICGNPYTEDHRNVDHIECNMKDYTTNYGRYDVNYICFSQLFEKQADICQSIMTQLNTQNEHANELICVIIIYDGTKHNATDIIPYVSFASSMGIPAFVIGNKKDSETFMEVDTQLIKSHYNDVRFFSVSCKNNDILEPIIELLALLSRKKDIKITKFKPQAFDMKSVRQKFKAIRTSEETKYKVQSLGTSTIIP